MHETYIGIDPGKTGAIAVISNDFCEAWPFAKYTLAELAANLDTLDAPFAVLEQVHSSSQMGVVSAFSFGQSYGQCEGLLAACGIPFDRVTPKKWQDYMKCRSGGNKNVTKKRASELFPTMKITHANADALLIAEYARRICGGRVEA